VDGLAAHLIIVLQGSICAVWRRQYCRPIPSRTSTACIGLRDSGFARHHGHNAEPVMGIGGSRSRYLGTGASHIHAMGPDPREVDEAQAVRTATFPWPLRGRRTPRLLHIVSFDYIMLREKLNQGQKSSSRRITEHRVSLSKHHIFQSRDYVNQWPLNGTRLQHNGSEFTSLGISLHSSSWHFNHLIR